MDELTRFGSYEKRYLVVSIYCTPEEKQKWKQAFGRSVGKLLRRLLDTQVAKGVPLERPFRPPWYRLTAQVNFKCNESELWQWRLVMPMSQRSGVRSALWAVAGDLLNEECKRVS